MRRATHSDCMQADYVHALQPETCAHAEAVNHRPFDRGKDKRHRRVGSPTDPRDRRSRANSSPLHVYRGVGYAVYAYLVG